MTYAAHLIGVLLPHLVAVAALQIVYRRGGLLALNYGAVMGIGGYTYALASLSGFGGLLPSLAVGAAAAGLLALLLYPVISTDDRRFVLATLALQLTFTAVCKGSTAAGGEGGIRGLPQPSLLGAGPPVGGTAGWVLAVGCASLVFALWCFEKSRLDLKLRAVADDPGLAEDIGFSSKNIRQATLCISFAAAGAAGALAAAFRGGVSPDDFGVYRSVLVLSSAALAWDRSVAAALVTGVFLAAAAEVTRVMNISFEAEKILYGVLIIFAVGRGVRHG